MSLTDWQYRVLVEGDRIDLQAGPDIGCFEVTSANGARMGWLIGFPIDLIGRRVIDGSFQSCFSTEIGLDTLAREFTASLGGRFLWVADMPGFRRIYPDILSNVPCIYDCENKVAALTAPILWEEEDAKARFLPQLVEQMRVDGEGWLPAGLTAYRGASRLMPNHYLDLDSWTVQRFRGAADFFSPFTLEQAADAVAASIAAQTEALVHSGKKVAVALTAGRDCRMVAAASERFKDRLAFFNLTSDNALDFDTIIPRRITRELGLEHIELPRQFADDDARAAYIARGGHCVSGQNSRLFISVEALRDDYVIVGGLGGENCRGCMWNPGDDGSIPTAPALISRFGLPQHELAVEKVEAWLKDVDTSDAKQVYELAYIEVMLACWASAQFPCDPTIVRYHPLLTVPAMQAMLGLSTEDKIQKRLPGAIVDRYWPELGNYPINSLGTVGDFLAKVQRVVRDPEVLVRRARRLSS